jgi:hypothetical protein
MRVINNISHGKAIRIESLISIHTLNLEAPFSLKSYLKPYVLKVNPKREAMALLQIL